jgi:hypothetical protein
MTRDRRQVDDCCFRGPSPGEEPSEAARCGLLAQVTGAVDETFFRVRRDACEACCRSFPPSAEEMNPVVASLAYELSSRIVQLGGVPGCDHQRADALMCRSLEGIPSEEDCLEVCGGSTDGASRRIAEVLPAPPRRSAPLIRHWAVGVTTAPRRVSTLNECLAALARAGWPVPRLFVDGNVTIPQEIAQLPQTVRQPRIGAWPNYYLALGELLLRHPQADAYLLVQDDALVCDDADLRVYLEDVLWPGKSAGIASLFCSRAYTQPQAGWYEFDGPWLWGALAFVFSRKAAQRFLADREVVEHRWARRRNPLADIDWRIGQWAWRNDVPVYYPTPSLVQHIGEVSSLWQGSRAHGYRRANWFAGSR